MCQTTSIGTANCGSVSHRWLQLPCLCLCPPSTQIRMIDSVNITIFMLPLKFHFLLMLKSFEATFHKRVPKINNVCLESLQFVFLNLNMTCLEMQNNLLAQFLFFLFEERKKSRNPQFLHRLSSLICTCPPLPPSFSQPPTHPSNSLWENQINAA